MEVKTFKKLYYKIQRSIWLYPVIYSFFAILMAFMVVLIDSKLIFDFNPYLPNVLLTSPDLAKSVLSIIAGAFITIMTFTFSTTMVVLTMYTSQFSPRVVENFLSEKSTMKSFGIFVSGFIYAIISLLFIRDILSEFKILAGTIGVIYIIVGIVNFIIYINNVGTYIQASNLIDRLYNKAHQDISEYQESIQDYATVEEKKMKGMELQLFVNSPGNGYIQEIDYERLHEIAIKTKTNLVLDRIAGEFLTDESPVVGIYYDHRSELYDDLEDDIKEAIMIGERRTETQDFNFSIQKMVEVALKALSPGINDPNTAIACIEKIGLLIRNLAHMKQGYIRMTDDQEEFGALYRENYHMDILLTHAFHQIIHYGKGDIYVMMTVMKAYSYILEKADQVNKEIILTHGGALYEKLSKELTDEKEISMIQKEYQHMLAQKAFLKAKRD